MVNLLVAAALATASAQPAAPASADATVSSFFSAPARSGFWRAINTTSQLFRIGHSRAHCSIGPPARLM